MESQRPSAASAVAVDESKFKHTTRGRVRADVEQPVSGFLEGLWEDGMPHVQLLREHLRREGRLHPSDALRLVRALVSLFWFFCF